MTSQLMASQKELLLPWRHRLNSLTKRWWQQFCVYFCCCVPPIYWLLCHLLNIRRDFAKIRKAKRFAEILQSGQISRFVFEFSDFYTTTLLFRIARNILEWIHFWPLYLDSTDQAVHVDWICCAHLPYPLAETTTLLQHSCIQQPEQQCN